MTDVLKDCVWGDLNYQDAMNRKIRTVNTCIISQYSVVRILKQVCFLLMADLPY